MLQLTQTRRIRRGQIYRKVVGIAVQTVHTLDIIAGRLVVGVSLFLPKFTPNNVSTKRPLERSRLRRRAMACIPWLLKPMRLINADARADETCAARIAGLGQRSHGAHLDKAETAAG